MFTSAVRFLVSLLAVFVLLITMWVSAASASELPTESFPGMTCTRQPLANGRVGETVLVCTSRVTSHRKVRVMRTLVLRTAGVTTVVHMGARG